MVYVVTIPNFGNLSDELIRTLSHDLTALARWTTRESPTGAIEGVSEKVNKDTLDKLTQVLTGHRVQYAVEDVSDQYLLAVTTAPEAYDYPYTVALAGFGEMKDEFDRPVRQVAIQKERQEYQFGRYSSGLHGYRIVK